VLRIEEGQFQREFTLSSLTR